MANDPIVLASAGSPPGGGGARPTLAHAALEVYESTPAAGGAKPGSQIERIEFQFNPKELSITKTAKYERKTARGAKSAGPPEFSGSDAGKLSLEIFFDATDKMDDSVVGRVESLFRCTVPTKKSLSTKKPWPPLVILHWGKVTTFAAFVTSVQAKYTLFAADGTPVRAVCTVALEEMPGNPPKQNPTSGALAARSTHTVTDGESLATIAYREYGDPRLWRHLAAFNGIDDPLRLALGSTVLVPSADELLMR